MNKNVATNPERTKGSTISQIVRHLLAPRISAACSISMGTSSIKLFVIHTEYGSVVRK